jgi:hypothetical protein
MPVTMSNDNRTVATVAYLNTVLIDANHDRLVRLDNHTPSVTALNNRGSASVTMLRLVRFQGHNRQKIQAYVP